MGVGSVVSLALSFESAELIHVPSSWCAIFLAIGFVFCFFFMEETNYDRPPQEMTSSQSPTPGSTTPKESGDPEKNGGLQESPPTVIDTSLGEIRYTPKTYLQKLSLLDKPRPFHIFGMMKRPLIFLSWPVIAYAGFSYGSNLIVGFPAYIDIRGIINDICK